MKIFIAVPTYENIYPDTFKAIYGLNRGDHWVVFDFVRGYDCATARNSIGRQAIAEKSDYVLMVDNDVTIPGEALINLLSHGEDAVLGFYAHRDSGRPYDGATSVCKLYKPNGEKWYNYPHESQYTIDELRTMRENGEYKVQIHGGGMGCALIKTELFEKLEFPWFAWVNYPNGRVLGEDLYFCEVLKKNNIPVYTDTRVACGHMMRNIQEVR